MQAASHCLQSLRDVAKTVERDWISTSLASVTDEHGIADDTRELSKSVWSILKTLLFTTIMVSDAALSASVFLPPRPLPSRITPTTLALQTLHTLGHLAFVISQFGGVTSTSPNAFVELKKTFYLALDILAQGDSHDGVNGPSKAEAYVEQVCVALNGQRVMEGNVAFRQAKEAFALASIEQLVPVLSGRCVREAVWGVCYPHLFCEDQRETFEAAHSTVLAIFASHAQQQQQRVGGAEGKGVSVTSWVGRMRGRVCKVSRVQGRSASPPPSAAAKVASSSTEAETRASQGGSIDTDFVTKMVPFYAKCLIEVRSSPYSTHIFIHNIFLELERRQTEHDPAPHGVRCARPECMRVWGEREWGEQRAAGLCVGVVLCADVVGYHSRDCCSEAEGEGEGPGRRCAGGFRCRAASPA